MIVKEGEASNFWCPMARAGSGASAAPYMERTGSGCVGSRCMMWRWANEKPHREFVPAANLHAKAEAEAGDRPAGIPPDWVFSPCVGKINARWQEPQLQWESRRTGYCGLAGRQERV